uniref:Golgin subfamily A member 1 n=1 Tax=Denticeps clupeoides TaxID=299321 RepID=A0AAY4DLY1_9TELE
MFAKLKKKIAEEAESITSVGADSGDDFASDGSSSRGDDLSSQILRRNDQIRKLEAKLSASMRKLQEQNEAYQSNRAKMAEGMALALDKKDQEWMEKMASLEQEKASLSARLAEMTEQSLSLFQKRDDLDELEGFQQQELAKVKHMLLRREEQLGQRERELQQKEGQLQTARSSLAEAQAKLHRLDGEHQENCRINEQLQAERDQSEQKVGELEARSRDLQELIQQVSEDFQQSQKKAQDLESSLNSLQTEHEELQLEHEQHKQKVCVFLFDSLTHTHTRTRHCHVRSSSRQAAVREEERECVLSELQEKVSSLERRLEGNLSQDEHLQELLKEKSSVEQRLEEVRVELLQERSSHADTVSSLEAQTSRLNGSVAELQMLLRHKDDSSKAYRERTDAQISSLEQQVDEFTRKLRSAERQLADSEAHVQTLQEGWVEERERLQQQVGSQRQRGLERCGQLEEQLGVLRRQRDAENAASQAALVSGETSWSGSDAEVRLHTIAQELEQARAELSSRQTVSVEIAKALEDTRRQKEELQIQVWAARGDVDQLKADAADREQVMSSLRQEVVSQTEQLDSCQSRVLDLEGELESLSEQLQTSEVCDEEQNGTVTVDDLDHLQKVNRDLELQLSDKNKTIKQLQQRLAELKRTLQKELKLKPESEADCRPQENRGERQDDRPNQDTAATAPGPGPVTPNTTVINSADLTDTREINFEYLKHVVLKFMSSREAEAYQLIRAVSVLLRFTREEEDLLKQTLEYKMSWFGSKPAPKGIARPSISGATDHWS